MSIFLYSLCVSILYSILHILVYYPFVYIVQLNYFLSSLHEFVLQCYTLSFSILIGYYHPIYKFVDIIKISFTTEKNPSYFKSGIYIVQLVCYFLPLYPRQIEFFHHRFLKMHVKLSH